MFHKISLKSTSRFLPIAVCALCSLFVVSCTNIECPLENVVMMRCGIYDKASDKPLNLNDTLRITAMGTASILWNRGYGLSEFSLPLRNNGSIDTFLLHISNDEAQRATDTLYIHHTPTNHLESVDCPASVFHSITRATHTSHNTDLMPTTLDSVAIVRSKVDYETNQNIKLYLHTVAL